MVFPIWVSLSRATQIDAVAGNPSEDGVVRVEFPDDILPIVECPVCRAISLVGEDLMSGIVLLLLIGGEVLPVSHDPEIEIRPAVGESGAP
jgi:hypothetical protein